MCSFSISTQRGLTIQSALFTDLSVFGDEAAMLRLGTVCAMSSCGDDAANCDSSRAFYPLRQRHVAQVVGSHNVAVA